MKIELDKLSKRFNYDWIFRELSYSFEAGKSYGILGPNGSGKSTLLKLISSQMVPDSGKLTYSNNGNTIPEDLIYSYYTLSAPYQELPDDLTFEEIISFHSKLQSFKEGLDIDALIDLSGLESNRNKLYRNFSSGMKQRVKLCLAICSDTPVLLLDEPTSNLDADAVKWYHSLMDRFASEKLVIIASNNKKDELYKVQNSISITDFK